MSTLTGAVVLVTGANGGMGTAFVHKALARCAAKDDATARRPRSQDDDRVVALALDIADAESVAAAVRAAPDVTVLVGNAGVLPPTASLLELSAADLRPTMDTNFFAPVLLTTAFAPVLTAHPSSVLIDMHSVASWYANGGAQSSSKAALWSATNSLRLELAPKGTHVIGVHVRYVDTAMAARADGDKLPPVDLVRQLFGTLESASYELMADQVTASVKAGLSAPVEALYPELRSRS